MAVTISAEDLAAQLPTTVENPSLLAERILAFAPTLLEKKAPDAPEAIANEATIRLAAYLADRASISIAMIREERAAAGVVLDQFSNAFRYSGAQSLLLPWISHGLGIVDDEEEDET